MTPSDDRDGGPVHALGPWQEVEFATVTDPEAGALLSDPAWLGWLEPFLGRTSGVAEAARRLGEPLDAVRYRVRRLERAGLIEVVGERRRAGRPVRLYRSVADGFVVPFEATPFVDLEERMTGVLAHEVRAFARSAAVAMRDSGLEARRVYRGPDGAVHQESAADEEALAAAAETDPIEALSLLARLPRSVARDLLRELVRFARRVERLEVEPPGDASGPVRTYRMMLMLAPEPDDPRG
jgi:DNA-binding transcriptional ArsR family regulator